MKAILWIEWKVECKILVSLKYEIRAATNDYFYFD